jgi:hypothetical protein
VPHQFRQLLTLHLSQLLQLDRGRRLQNEATCSTSSKTNFKSSHHL